MKKFNTTAVCIPSKHYMVDLYNQPGETIWENGNYKSSDGISETRL